jgi:nucleoside 2-deoxyribosyltransferase
MESSIKSAYFVGSIKGKEEYSKNYRQIVNTLEDMGIEVFTIVDVLNTELLKDYTDKDHKKHLKRALKKIKDADVFIAEVSSSSTTIGYEIGYAVASKKPTLLLRDDSTQESLGPPMRSNPSKLVQLNTYNLSNLKNEISKFIRKAEKGIFVKRLPIEFTQEQVDFIQKLQISGPKKKSFNSVVRMIIDEKIKEEIY